MTKTVKTVSKPAATPAPAKKATPAIKAAAKPAAKKVVPAKKAVTPAKSVKPMKKATPPLGTQTKKKVDHTPKTETKIADLRTGIGALYGR